MWLFASSCSPCRFPRSGRPPSSCCSSSSEPTTRRVPRFRFGRLSAAAFRARIQIRISRLNRFVCSASNKPFQFQIAFAATLLTTIDELWGVTIRNNFISHRIFILLTCMVFMVFNSLFITKVSSIILLANGLLRDGMFFLIAKRFHSFPQKGILLILSIDTYITIWLTVILALIEVILIGWFYGMCSSTAKVNCIEPASPGRDPDRPEQRS